MVTHAETDGAIAPHHATDTTQREASTMRTSFRSPVASLPDADVVLIGGGIMSATLASVLAVLEPQWRVQILERATDVATESSNPWNNAGTGHSGYCELNYMPDPTDPATPAKIAHDFLVTRQWWAHLALRGTLDPARFVRATPHLDLVFGEHDVAYLRKRYETLRHNQWFPRIEFTDDPAQIAAWAPLVMAGRTGDEPVAATRVVGGTDVDFGSLTGDLTASASAGVRYGHEVRSLRRHADGRWVIGGRTRADNRFRIRAKFVFVGAGGQALHLLQKARVPEVRGYGVFPVGAAFLRCDDPTIARRHDAKVYGQAATDAPPMSVPHLDRRVVDGRDYLMFGPYATFSTKLLKHGSRRDFFTTLRPHNLLPLAVAAVDNADLVRYLVGQLLASRRAKFAELRRYYPDADPAQWTMIAAGQRAQLVTPDPARPGVLRSGTELVVGADATMAGLLGASPGASTAVPIMFDLLRQAFPDAWAQRWQRHIDDAAPAYGRPVRDAAEVSAALADTAAALGLDEPGATPHEPRRTA